MKVNVCIWLGAEMAHTLGNVEDKIKDPNFKLSWADKKHEFAYGVAIGMVSSHWTCHII